MQYMLAIYGEEGGWDDFSPEQMEEGLELWGNFERELVGADSLIAGEALQPSATATTARREGDEHTITDGPFVETKEQLGGFYLIEAENLDEALEWAKKVPVSDGQSVEVRPIMDFTQFGWERPTRVTSGAR